MLRWKLSWESLHREIPITLSCCFVRFAECPTAPLGGTIGPGGSLRRQPNFAKFPVFFPVIRELGAETGSQYTASSASQCGSVPDTWVMDHTEDMGNTFGPKGLSSGSSLQLSWSK